MTPARYRVLARWCEAHGHRLEVRRNAELIGTMPDTRENIACLRRMAESHAGSELDWKPGNHADTTFGIALWVAPAPA